MNSILTLILSGGHNSYAAKRLQGLWIGGGSGVSYDIIRIIVVVNYLPIGRGPKSKTLYLFSSKSQTPLAMVDKLAT